MTDYLVNPARKRRSKPARTKPRARRTSRKRRSPPKGFTSWGAYMASIRPSRAHKEKKTMSKRKRSRSHRRARHAVAIVRRGRTRRSYRRNPPIGRGIIGKVMQGVTDAALGVAGKAVSRAVPSLVGLPQAGAVGIATQAAVGVVAGMLADKVRPGIGRAVLQGALMGPIETLVKGFNIPIISTALGDDYQGYALSGYDVPGLAGYVGAAGLGDGAGELYSQQQM
jgi:hypothetical protein